MVRVWAALAVDLQLLLPMHLPSPLGVGGGQPQQGVPLRPRVEWTEQAVRTLPRPAKRQCRVDSRQESGAKPFQGTWAVGDYWAGRVLSRWFYIGRISSKYIGFVKFLYSRSIKSNLRKFQYKYLSVNMHVCEVLRWSRVANVETNNKVCPVEHSKGSMVVIFQWWQWWQHQAWSTQLYYMAPDMGNLVS